MREVSPAYNKPEQSTIDYASKKIPVKSSNGGGREIDLGEHLGLERELQKELSDRIRHRRRSHSMSSRGEKGRNVSVPV